MKSLHAWNSILRKNVRLSAYTTLEIGGAAQYFIQPQSLEELLDFAKALNKSESDCT